MKTKKAGVTDSEGMFSFVQVAAGDHKVNFAKTGFGALTMLVEVPLGVVSSIGTVLMQPAVLEVAAAVPAVEAAAPADSGDETPAVPVAVNNGAVHPGEGLAA